MWLRLGVFPSSQNGNVFVFTGMLDAVADIHQLTIVLGHEMAHAILSHSVSVVLWLWYQRLTGKILRLVQLGAAVTCSH